MKFFKWLFLLWLLVWGGCGVPPIPRKAEASFYFWRTQFQLDETEQKYLKSLKAKQLYVRFFDVDWNEYENQAVPIGLISVDLKHKINLPIIPTVFITNRTFLQLPDNQVISLAEKISQKVLALAANITSQKISEIQLDCDWSERTRANYFQLLEAINQQVKGQKISLSATIRLHQFKYPQKTGVPPVSRGMLMFYNMGNLTGNNTENSILDLKIAEQYVKNNSSYPLALDVALPLFGWGVLSRRNRVINLLNNLQATDLQDLTKYELAKSRQYRVKKSHYLQGIYVYQNDLIRLEAVEPKQLWKAAEQLKKIDLPNHFSLSFYHLDSKLLNKFSVSDLQTVVQKCSH
jgi:hypothetical protein